MNSFILCPKCGKFINLYSEDLEILRFESVPIRCANCNHAFRLIIEPIENVDGDTK